MFNEKNDRLLKIFSNKDVVKTCNSAINIYKKKNNENRIRK